MFAGNTWEILYMYSVGIKYIHAEKIQIHCNFSYLYYFNLKYEYEYEYMTIHYIPYIGNYMNTSCECKCDDAMTQRSRDTDALCPRPLSRRFPFRRAHPVPLSIAAMRSPASRPLAAAASTGDP